MAVRIAAQARSPENERCPMGFDGFDGFADVSARRCPQCQARYHLECADVCVTADCGASLSSPLSQRPPKARVLNLRKPLLIIGALSPLLALATPTLISTASKIRGDGLIYAITLGIGALLGLSLLPWSSEAPDDEAPAPPRETPDPKAPKP